MSYKSTDYDEGLFQAVRQRLDLLGIDATDRQINNAWSDIRSVLPTADKIPTELMLDDSFMDRFLVPAIVGYLYGTRKRK
jgi:hypothetical protein